MVADGPHVAGGVRGARPRRAGLSDVTDWPYQVVGAGYGVVGVGFMLVAHWRVRTVEAAVDRGEFARLDERISLVLLVIGIALGGATVALVVFAN